MHLRLAAVQFLHALRKSGFVETSRVGYKQSEEGNDVIFPFG